jgi:putative oxidoreductase
MASKKIVLWILQIIPALILLQTLFFKFTGAAEAVDIFTTLGVEPWGRILVGIFELVSSVMLVIPSFAVFGGLLAVLLMIGAIILHLFILGITDLFWMAVVVFICSSIVVWMRRNELPFIS